MDVVWRELPNGFEAVIGEGALNLLVVRDERGWRSCINDRVVKHAYPDAEEAKRATVSWARQKLEMMKAELYELEHPIR